MIKLSNNLIIVSQTNWNIKAIIENVMVIGANTNT